MNNYWKNVYSRSFLKDSVLVFRHCMLGENLFFVSGKFKITLKWRLYGLNLDKSKSNTFITVLTSLPLQLMKAAVPAESYVIHLSSASLFSCDVYGQ